LRADRRRSLDERLQHLGHQRLGLLQHRAQAIVQGRLQGGRIVGDAESELEHLRHGRGDYGLAAQLCEACDNAGSCGQQSIRKLSDPLGSPPVQPDPGLPFPTPSAFMTDSALARRRADATRQVGASTADDI
jgi:hypothetical protein